MFSKSGKPQNTVFNIVFAAMYTCGKVPGADFPGKSGGRQSHSQRLFSRLLIVLVRPACMKRSRARS